MNKFDATFKDGRMLLRILELASIFTEELVFNCTSTGIKVQVRDQADVSVLDIHLSMQIFLSYRCMPDVNFGINVAVVRQFFQACSTNEYMTLSYVWETERVQFMFGRPEMKRKFSIRALHLISDELDLTEQRPQWTACVPAKLFCQSSWHIDRFGEMVQIGCTCDSLIFQSESKDCDFTVTLKNPPKFQLSPVVLISNPVPRIAAYPSKIVMAMGKASELTDKVYLAGLESDLLEIKLKLGLFSCIRCYVVAKNEDDVPDNNSPDENDALPIGPN